MRGNAARALAIAFALAAAAAPSGAFVEGVLVGNGDKITTAVDDVGDTDAFTVGAGAGGKISVTAAAAKGSFVLPVLRLFDNAGAEVDVALLLKGAGTKKVSLKNFPVPAGGTGEWTVLVSGGSTFGGYTASFKVADPKTVVRKGLLVPDGQEVAIPVPTAAGATLSGKVKILAGTAPETLLFRADAAAGGGTALLQPAFTAARGLPADVPVESRTRQLSSVALAKNGGAGDCTLDLTVKVKTPKVVKRKVFLPPEGGVAGVAPGIVRQEQAPVLTLDGVFVHGEPSPRIYATLPGEDAEDAGVGVTASGFSGVTSTDPDSGVVLSPGATATLAVAPDAAYGARDLVYVPPPLLGEPNRLAGALVVRAPVPTVLSVSPASLRQEGTSILLTVTGTGFRTGGALSFSGAGIVAGATTVVDATTAEVTVSVDADAAVGLRDVTFTQPVQGGGSSGTGTGVLTVRNPIPSVASAAPATLRQEDAGVVVAFAGTGFRAGGTLSVSGTGVSAGAATVVNGNQVTVPLTVAFDAAIGPRSATWTQPAAGGGDAATGTDVLTIQFPTPTVTSASPAFVRQLDAAKVVTVTGTGFRAGGVLAISGAGLALGATTVVNATTATVAVTVDEFAAVGARDVTFTQAAGGGGASGTRTSGLSVFHPVPTLTSFTPTTVVQGTSGISVVLTGQRFRDGGVVSAGSGMTFTGGTRDSDTQFTVTLAVGSLATLGLRDLVYTQPAAGGSDAATKANSLQVNAPDPTVTAIDVATVKQNDAAVARFLTGTNFRSGGTVTVSGTGVTVGGVVVTSATRVDFNLTVTNGAAIGPRNVTWTQPASGGGAAATLTNGLTVNFPDPTVTSASPSQIDREATNLTLTLTGTNFRAGGTVSISGTEVTLSSPAHVNDTTFTVLYSVSATAALGLRNLTYTHTGGGGASATKTNAVEVMPVGVDLSSLAPSAWIPGTSRFRCVATGANFNSGTSTSVSGSGVTVHGTIFVSSTKLDLELSVDSSAALGARDVTITPGAGGGSPKTFTGAAVVAVAPPRVASFSAPALSQGASSVAVVVLGSGFLTGDTLAASGSGVTFSSVTVVNEGKITATAAVDGAAATGNRDVTVTRSAGNGGLADSLSPAFQVVSAAPTLTAVNPSKVGRTGSGGATREVPIVLTGTNFMTGATLSVTKTSASGVSVVSSSEVVVSSTEMRATLSVTGTATTGTWDLQVANPGSLGNSGSGGAGLLDVKDENTLCVHRVIASSGTAFGGERVTVHGSGFAAGVVVDFGSVRAPGTLFLDKGTLVTTVPMPATQSRTSPAIVDVKVTKTDASNATLTGGYAYAKDDGEFRVTGAFPAQGATGVPKNLVSTVIRLSYPADTTTGTYGTTTGTNVFWFESSGSFVSSALRGFGPGGRFLVLSRTGGGNLPIASAGTYVRDIPVTLTSLGGNPLSVQRIASVTHDQYSFTISSSATDTTAPTLSSISPADTANPVDVTTKVTIVFSEEIDPLTVNATNITFKQGSTVIGADMAMADDLRTVTITPHAVLAASQTFTTNVTASVKDLFGNAYTNTSYTFTTGNGTDGTPAVVDAVILEGLPADMDGSGTFVNSSGTGGNAFDAYLPQDGWLVDVRFSDEGGSGVDASKFSAKASVAVAGNSANAELASNFAVTPTGATWRIPSSGFAAGDNATFTFTITDLANNTAGSKTVTFDVVSKDATASGAGGGDHDPFDARRTWILRGDLDAYTATYSTATSPNRQGATTTVATSNVPDLDEALRLVGLNTASMTTDASNAVNGNDTGTNAILRRLFMERLREAMRERYHITEDGVHGADSVDVEFLLPGEQGSLSSMPTFSTANSSSSTKAFSELSVGGTLGADASAFSAAGTLGQAWLDPRNRGEEANLNFGAGGNITGLYLMGMLKLQVNGGTGTVFGSRISAKLVAIHGGTPAGENSLDDDVLAGSFDRTNGGNSAAQNTRYDEIMDAVELIALYTSAVGAHEVGHSTGLVPDGAPKTGLFGNAHYSNTFTEATSVTPNTSAHLDFLGNDIMAASTGFESGVTTGADFKRFSPMDVAYLRNRLVHDEGK